MKKIFVSLFVISLLCGFAFAQNSLPELEIAREIKLLKSSKSDVDIIMSEFDREADSADEEDEDYNQEFRSERATIKVSYSTGDCAEDAGIRNYPEWNVPKMTATKVLITFEETTKLEDLGLNLSNFKKKLKDEDDEDPEEYIYYDKKAGILILTDEGEVEKIFLHPPKKQSSRLCLNENNEEVTSGKTSFIKSILNSENYCILRNRPSNVTNLELQTKGVFGCEGGDCSDAKKEILVKTTAIDSEDDYLTYNYTISGGKINGSGSEVIWDLTGVQPGTYTITAGSEDSCGVCGETKTRQISVNENSYEITPTAKIENLILDKTELLAGCPTGRLKRTLCPFGNCSVAIASIASGGENITYRYKDYAGKIIGSGSSIIWDLSGLAPGRYSISVTASDDNASSGNVETATVEIKENQDCKLSTID